MKFTLALCCIAFLAVVQAQNFGNYRRTTTQKKYYTVTSSSGGSGDGQYVHDNSGSYKNNDGRYHPDDSGRYVHKDDKYKHQDSQYQHQDDKYKHAGGGFGAGAGEKYQVEVVETNQYTSGGLSSHHAAHHSVATGFGAGNTLHKLHGSVHGSTDGSVTSQNHLAQLGAVSSQGIGALKITQHLQTPSTGSSQNQGKTQYHHTGSASSYENNNYRILRQEDEHDEDGYHYLYETENGITGEEQGKLANRGTDEEAMRAHGFYTYTGPDNVVYTVRYTADENGFVPEGDHIPTPPPIPAAILRALEYQKSLGTL